MIRPVLTLIGFLLIIVSFLSIVFSLIGLGLSPLSVLDHACSTLGAFVIKLALLVVGIIIFYYGRLYVEQE